MIDLNPAIEIIKKFEGCKLVSYLCPAGKWTIGYGLTYYSNGKPVKEGDSIDQATAEQELWVEVNRVANEVRKATNHWIILSNNQLCALTSFCFNVGLGNFKRSTMIRFLNRGDYSHASLEFEKWNKSKGKVLKGLTARRKAEKELFLKPQGESK